MQLFGFTIVLFNNRDNVELACYQEDIAVTCAIRCDFRIDYSYYTIMFSGVGRHLAICQDAILVTPIIKCNHIFVSRR